MQRGRTCRWHLIFFQEVEHLCHFESKVIYKCRIWFQSTITYTVVREWQWNQVPCFIGANMFSICTTTSEYIHSISVCRININVIKVWGFGFSGLSPFWSPTSILEEKHLTNSGFIFPWNKHESFPDTTETKIHCSRIAPTIAMSGNPCFINLSIPALRTEIFLVVNGTSASVNQSMSSYFWLLFSSEGHAVSADQIKSLWGIVRDLMKHVTEGLSAGRNFLVGIGVNSEAFGKLEPWDKSAEFWTQSRCFTTFSFLRNSSCCLI